MRLWMKKGYQMKKLCVLEQSRTINDPYVPEKKKLFQTDNCDFFHLNWRYEDDPDATVTAPGVLWSEGRSILFETVARTYDYYMFIDDDIVFHKEGDKPLDETIIDLLDEFQPVRKITIQEKISDI